MRASLVTHLFLMSRKSPTPRGCTTRRSAAPGAATARAFSPATCTLASAPRASLERRRTDYSCVPPCVPTRYAALRRAPRRCGPGPGPRPRLHAGPAPTSRRRPVPNRGQCQGIRRLVREWNLFLVQSGLHNWVQRVRRFERQPILWQRLLLRQPRDIARDALVLSVRRQGVHKAPLSIHRPRLRRDPQDLLRSEPVLRPRLRARVQPMRGSGWRHRRRRPWKWRRPPTRI